MIEQINKQGTVNGQTFTRATITPDGTDKVYDLAFFDGGGQPVAVFPRLDRQTIDALKLVSAAWAAPAAEIDRETFTGTLEL